MGIKVDIAYKSLNKNEEELCGDKVEILHTEDSHILILADGMGSGVKANILATMTSKILGTMFLRGILLEECVETIAETLPVCKVRQMAYATFSILQVYDDGSAYLVEFDNPGCIFIRNGKIMKIPENYRMIENRRINEYHFNVQMGDAFILLSDGAINAGVGELLNFGWNWDSVAEYALREYGKTISAMHLAAAVSQACNDLYQYRPGDDTTVAVLRIGEKKLINLMTGPAANQEDDEAMIKDFMADGSALKIVCGGTSANIVARVLEKKIDVSVGEIDPNIPPTAYIEGIDLVTEGVVTLNRVLKFLEQYTRDDEIDEEFFMELDKPNGASMLAKLLIESCTDLHLFVGKAVNGAYQNTELPFQLGVRQKLVDQIEDVMRRLGKTVAVKYY
ncbi:SpoIIE family protein phosphatase [[Clostridium] symbiosum]|uniref:SpoIIE family protein phosphatase n=1 Tax=Clostridium symbiosum TaxID=1512 RepID=UPI001D076DBD|nr:SpoIIE family protein phosphatase [[Clostridium] symbiosum]MCB6610924.1 serine/threonine-protein phosphatase [[Clostridium] symbiosum]MCB6931630.1 serine/threonine-protein phosphatase [[Clostridium] symbiosum]